MFIKEGYYPCQTIEDEQDVLLVGAADLAYMDVYREDDLRAAVSFVIFEYPSMKVFQLANNLLIASFSSSEVSDVWRRKYRSILKTLFFRNRPYFLLHFSTSNHTWNGVWFLKATFRIIWQLEKLNLSRNLFGRMTFTSSFLTISRFQKDVVSSWFAQTWCDFVRWKWHLAHERFDFSDFKNCISYIS